MSDYSKIIPTEQNKKDYRYMHLGRGDIMREISENLEDWQNDLLQNWSYIIVGLDRLIDRGNYPLNFGLIVNQLRENRFSQNLLKFEMNI